MEELLQKLVILDINVEMDNNPETISRYLQKKRAQIGHKTLWSLEVVDAYPLSKEKTRYTLRAAYEGMSDKEAKKKHLGVFGG